MTANGSVYFDELGCTITAEGEVKMTKAELITMIKNAGFEAVERDTVYCRVEKAFV